MNPAVQSCCTLQFVNWQWSCTVRNNQCLPLQQNLGGVCSHKHQGKHTNADDSLCFFLFMPLLQYCKSQSDLKLTCPYHTWTSQHLQKHPWYSNDVKRTGQNEQTCIYFLCYLYPIPPALSLSVQIAEFDCLKLLKTNHWIRWTGTVPACPAWTTEVWSEGEMDKGLSRLILSYRFHSFSDLQLQLLYAGDISTDFSSSATLNTGKQQLIMFVPKPAQAALCYWSLLCNDIWPQAGWEHQRAAV